MSLEISIYHLQNHPFSLVCVNVCVREREREKERQREKQLTQDLHWHSVFKYTVLYY